jgi:predicted porin
MKKTLIAVAALAATGAFAQVTVYGRLDAGYAMTTNSTGTTDVKDNGIRSHNSFSSFWGIKGVDDLGGGMKSSFQLDMDLYTANGNLGNSGAGAGAAATAQFNRVSRINLEGGFGQVGFGADYVPTFKLIGATDVNNLSRISTVNLSNSTGVSTTGSVLWYSTPVFSGFQVNAAYRNADQTSSAAAGDTSQKLTNLTATYSNGPLMVGVGTGNTENKTAGAATTTMSLAGFNTTSIAGATKIASNVVAGSYDFKVVKLMGNYITTKASDANTAGVATVGSDLDLVELNIGASIPMGKLTLSAALGTNSYKATGAASDSKGNDIVIGADYALSARTAVFVKTGTYSKLDNVSAAGVATGGTSENKQTSTAVGLRVLF